MYENFKHGFNETNFPGILTDYVGEPPVVDQSNVTREDYEYRMIYRLTIDEAAFGGNGFGAIEIIGMHNSPPKDGFDDGDTGTEIIPKMTTNEVAVTGDGASLAATDTDTATVNVDPNAVPPETPPETKFYVVDTDQDRTYEYSAAGGLVDENLLDGANRVPRGATANVEGTRVWVADLSTHVYVYDQDGISLGRWKADGIGDRTEGIATDGEDVWIVVNGTVDRVFFYENGASWTDGDRTEDSSFGLARREGNTRPQGITTDGVYLWVVDDSRKVFKYTVGGVLQGSWSIDSNNTKPTGITIDPSGGESIWIVDTGTDQVFQYDAATGLLSGSKTADAVFALAAGNSSPEGIADPPTSLRTSKMTAFDSASSNKAILPNRFADGLISLDVSVPADTTSFGRRQIADSGRSEDSNDVQKPLQPPLMRGVQSEYIRLIDQVLTNRNDDSNLEDIDRLDHSLIGRDWEASADEVLGELVGNL